MTLHDLSPWMDPRWHQNATLVRRRTPWLVRLGIATMVITPSFAVRQQTLDYFLINPRRVVAVHSAASLAPEPSRRDRPYFLFVGTLEPRKNLPALLEAWRQVRAEHDVDLVLAGRSRRDAQAIELEPGLILLGEVRDDELPSLYSGSIATIYPSLYEGFGLPVLEAMQCGAPVVTSKDPALLEVSQDAAIHVEPAKLADAMRLLLTDSSHRARRSDLSLQRGSEFSWARTARQTREVYVEAIRRFQS